jgi:hypothetical protein
MISVDSDTIVDYKIDTKQCKQATSDVIQMLDFILLFMYCSTVQNSAIQCSTVQYSTVQYSTVQCCMYVLCIDTDNQIPTITAM